MERIRRWAARVVTWSRHPEIIWVWERDQLRITVELRSWLHLLLLLGLLIWYIAAPSITIAMCLAGFAAMMGIAYLWVRQHARHLRAKRVLQYAAMQVGDELEEQIQLTNRSYLPALWIELVDRSDVPGYAVNGARGIDGSASTSWRVHAVCTRRGVYRLGPWEVHSGDPFGIFLLRQEILERQEILVYPPLAALPSDLLPHRGAIGDHRPLRQPLQAATIDSMGVRDYQHGDSLRHIHWPTTARQNAPYVKVFQPEAASRVWVLPDLDPACQWGSGPDSSEETTILLSASLVAEMLQSKLAVGVFSGGSSPSVVLPQRGQAQLWAVLEQLAPLHPQEGVSLAETLKQFQPLLNQRDLLVFVTASLDPAWLLSVRNVLYRRGGASARALVLDPKSFGGDQSAEQFLPAMSEAGVEGRIIRRGEIKPLPGIYGALSRWEFVVSGTGRAVARQAPRKAAMLFAGQQEKR